MCRPMLEKCSIMIESGNLTLKSHYEILDVKEDARSDEIRTCYRTAILSYHPDKMQTTSHTSNPANELGRRFLEVQRAWEILGDSKSRALYDNELQSSRQDSATAEDIRLEDLSIEAIWDIRCRKMGVKLFCKRLDLHLHLLFFLVGHARLKYGY
ncbi:DPH4 homolog [Olea europaea var. sylvestris]|uniref:DPH4 homolog n=1 Tax=Olea europaea var. sylvestris TaxID=158386 RepID=UPI000C1D719A|nr:DPH4 homolog [Olea europaea var. sylvestris]